MKTNQKPRGLRAAVLMGMLSVWVAQPAQLVAENGTPCLRTAKSLFHASMLDAMEEYHETIAICRNISDRDDRRDCVDEARESRTEDKQEAHAQREAREETCEVLDEFRYDPDPLADPAIEFVDAEDIGDSVEPNPYLDLTEGRTWVLRAGDDFEETVIITVTDETEEINGVSCRQVVDAAVETEDEDGEVDYEPVEVTDDYYAQDSDGNVYYCGEVSRNWEDGFLDNLDGSFLSGVEGAKGGLLIRSMPIIGESHRQEYAVNEAEDVVTTVSLSAIPSEDEGGDNPLFPCAPGCLQTFEFDPLDPESAELKYYIPGVGFVLAVSFEDGEVDGEREETTCVGDSLQVLEDPSCGIEDLESLLDALCEVSPDAFCEDDDD